MSSVITGEPVNDRARSSAHTRRPPSTSAPASTNPIRPRRSPSSLTRSRILTSPEARLKARARTPLNRPMLGGRQTCHMAGVLLDHITKKYGEVTAVADLNIQIQDREFLVLVGPSGCGKSTALRMVAGLEEITAGDIYIGDRRVNDVAPKDRDIAMVFQSYALYPHM